MKSITLDKANFNADYVASMPVDAFVASQAHQWPHLEAHQRDERLERAHQLSVELATPADTDEVKFTEFNPNPNGNSSSDAQEVPGIGLGGGIGGSHTADGPGSDSPTEEATVRKGRKGRRDEAE